MPTSPPQGFRDDMLAAADRRPFTAAGNGSDRGIVVCAGGPVMLVNAYVLVRVLRDTLGCTLPVEIWHMGPVEMPGHAAGLFSALGCEVRDAFETATARDAYRPCDGWQLKSHALAWSRFEQVLLLDADQVPATDPSCVFDWPEMRRAGAVFWPDSQELSEANPVWEITGLQPRRTRSMESGQLCIDRKRHWQALCIADEINRRAETFYSLIYGDKDSFLLAWLMTQSAFAMVPHLPYQAEKCLYQRDFGGASLFQHRTNCKFTLAGPHVFPDAFQHAADCERYLVELSRVWNGRIHHPPVRSPKARRAEDAIIEAGNFCLLGPDASMQHITLLAGHQVGRGRSHELANWHVMDATNGLELVLMDLWKPSMVLVPAGNGNWQGDRLIEPAGPVHLSLGEPRGETPAVASRWLRSLVAAAGCDAASLRTTLCLLARTDAGVAADVKRLADELAGPDPMTANRLSDIAAELQLPEAGRGGAVYGRAPMEPPLYRLS